MQPCLMVDMVPHAHSVAHQLPHALSVAHHLLHPAQVRAQRQAKSSGEGEDEAALMLAELLE